VPNPGPSLFQGRSHGVTIAGMISFILPVGRVMI
jgi:hypothetical protein